MTEEPLNSRDRVRTMKTDIEEAMRQEKASLIEMVAHSADTGSLAKREKDYSTTRILAIALILVVILGAGSGAWWYLRNSTPPQKQEFVIPRSIMPTDAESPIKLKNGDRTGLLAAFGDLQNKNSGASYIYTPYVITDITGDPRLGTIDEFFASLRIKPPPGFRSNLTGTWNIYVTSGSLVFIFETKDWLKTMGNMLGWEAFMEETFTPILKSAPDTAAHEFTDVLIKNYSARIQKLSEDSDLAIGYAIALQRYLIIATSEKALRDTLERLVAGPIIN